MLVVLLLFTALILIFFSIYHIFKKRLQYWKNKNVPYLKPVPVLGNFSEYILFKKYLGHVTQDLCQKLPNAPFFGAFFGTEPTLIVQDPDLIKQIMTKDFYFFSGREIAKYTQSETLIQNLFFSYGDRWKIFRQNLTPLFSTAKMKNMFYLIETRAQVFQNILDQDTKTSKVIEVTSLMARFTMDCVSSCAFGVNTNTLEKKENNPFRIVGEMIFDTRNYQAFKNIVRTIWPAIFYGLGFQTFPKKVESFFYKVLMDVFEERKFQPSNRNDFVDLILKLRNEKSITGDSLNLSKFNSGNKLSLEINDDMLIAQCVLFFSAGYDTSAITSSYTLYELAKNPLAQEKVLEEIDACLHRHDNVLKYDCVTELPYLEACIDEALRLYPVLATLTREVTEDYILPSGLKLEKGLRVHLPLYHLHHHPDHFPEPEKYRPQRFLGEEKQKIKPYTYMPFGEGPRLCIGMRFAKMQMIAGLITVLKKYRLELAHDMKREVEFEPKSMITHPIGGIRLKFVEREGWKDREFQSKVSS